MPSFSNKKKMSTTSIAQIAPSRRKLTVLKPMRRKKYSRNKYPSKMKSKLVPLKIVLNSRTSHQFKKKKPKKKF